MAGRWGAREAIELSPGGRVTFRDLGARTGSPILYCHGTPSSSVEARLFGTPEQLAELGVRLIAPDRPGSGGSTFVPGRRIVDWPPVARQLMDRLGISRFAVLGYSGGAPYALACCSQLPDRVTVGGLVSGTAPFDVPGATDDIAPQSLRFMMLSRSRPRTARLMSWIMGTTARLAPGRMAAQAAKSLPESDARVMQDRELGAAFARMVYETTHGSARGAQHDTELMVSPWGFDPSEVRARVLMWHGSADRNAPPAMAEHIASRLPTAELSWLEGEGHVSTPASHGRQILAMLKEASDRL